MVKGSFTDPLCRLQYLVKEGSHRSVRPQYVSIPPCAQNQSADGAAIEPFGRRSGLSSLSRRRSACAPLGVPRPAAHLFFTFPDKRQ